MFTTQVLKKLTENYCRPTLFRHGGFGKYLVPAVDVDSAHYQARLYSSTMSKPKVYVTREINKEALQQLKLACEVSVWTGNDPVPKNELIANIKDKEGLFCFLSDKIDKEVLDAAKELKAIGTMSVGFDHLDMNEINKRKIKVGYTPGVLTDATAELAVALLLATARRMFEANNAAKTGAWKAWSPFWMCGPSLQNSVVGIVGFGRVGQEIAKRVKPFKIVKILYVNRSEKREAKELDAAKVDFDSLLKLSDFVIASCALTEETKNLFNKEAFKKMKKSAVFVNISRGGVVDQDALIVALQEKQIWGAGLDVMTPEPLPLDSPLFKLNNCVILPHIGSAAISTRMEMASITVANITNCLKDRPMLYALN